MKIPKSSQDALAAQRRSFAQHLGQHLCLVADHRFVARVDAVFVLIFGAGPHPCGKVAGVLVQQVVDALLEPATHHRVGLGVQARGQSFECVRGERSGLSTCQ